MQWIPKKNNQTAKNMILLLFGGSFALLAVTAAFPAVPFRWIFQTIALLLLTAAVFLVTRYLTKMFVYRVVETDEGGHDLTVTEAATNGKRAVTVCRVGLEQIRRAVLLDFSDGGASLDVWKDFKKGRKRIHDYRVDLRPTKSILLIVNEGGEELYILLSHETDLFDLLIKYQKESPES